MTKDANQPGSGTGKHPDHFLAEWREYRGLKQSELGDLSGASNSKISRIETGETELKPSFAKKIARILNAPLTALFTVNPLGEGKDTAEMLDVWAQIEPRKRADALRVLRALTATNERDQIG